MNRNKTIEFTIYYNRYKTRIYNYVLRMIGNQMESEDIVQTVFLKFYENLDLIKNKESIRYWLFTTTRNQVYEHFRIKQTHVDKFDASDSGELEINAGIDISGAYELKELKQIIRDELENMPKEQKEAFFLKEYGQLSYREIGKLLGIDENLVKSRLFKARQKLIKILAKKIDGGS